jgi:maltose alpha-D-glucosyltransferase/alpha-amylase
VRHHRIDASRIRVHGDYHLGQVLHAGRLRDHRLRGRAVAPPTERRIKRGALTDVAGIVRSFQYAPRPGSATSRRAAWCRPTSTALATRGGSGQTWVTIAFIAAYLEAADGHLRAHRSGRHPRAAHPYVLDKALYEVRYDLDHRPDWAPIPLRGVASMLQSLGP